MRVLLLNQYYLPDVAATGQLLADLAEDLVKAGHEVHVICSQRPYSGGNKQFASEQVMAGVYVHRLAAFGFGHSTVLGCLMDYLSFFILAMWNVIYIPRPDICVTLTTPPFIGLTALVLKKLKGSPFIMWAMDIYPEIAIATGTLKRGSMIRNSLLKLNGRLYNNASCIISLGEAMTQKLIVLGAEASKIKTVHNWVPNECVKPKSSEQSLLRKQWKLDDKVSLMYSGNLGINFEVNTFVSALKRVCITKDFRVIFVGRGKSETLLRELLAKSGVGCVDFYLPVHLDQLSDSLAAGDVHIVFQRAGTLGLVVPSKLYSALAAGRPVIFIGPEESECAKIVRKSCAGIVIWPGDVMGLAEAISTLVDNHELRAKMGDRALLYYQQYFGRHKSVPRIIKAIEDVYNLNAR